jgi:amino acid transporter
MQGADLSALPLSAAVFILLAFLQIIALIAILYRHAIPRAPKLFHGLLLGPMLAGVVCLFILAWLALTGIETIFGLNETLVLFIYFGATTTTWGTLDFYALYHFRRMRQRYGNEERSVGQKLDTAATEAEDRFSEKELEQLEVRERLNKATIVSREELDIVAEELKAKLDGIERLLRDER